MKKYRGNLIKTCPANLVMLVLIISFVFFGMTSCCFGPASLISSLSDNSTSESDSVKILEKSFEKMLEEASSVSRAWIKDGNGKLVWQPSSIMNIKVYQDANTEKYFDMSKPVNFDVESDLLAPKDNGSSTEGSSVDGSGSQKVEFTWDLGNGQTAKGEKIKYTYTEAGVYTVVLTASFGSASDTCIETIWVAENSGNLLIFNRYDCNVEVESVLTNNGPEKLFNVAYGLDIPKTIEPLQEVSEVSTAPGQFKEKSNGNEDLFYSFYLGEIKANKTVSVKADYKVKISEFALNENPEDIKAGEDGSFEKIVKKYTKSEKYIDSDSDIIKNTSDRIIGQETDPLTVAKKLYDFVIDNMDYDWERFSNPDRKSLKASEILDIKKGVCEDYSLLYAALCRAAGIPAKYIAGIPVRSIAAEAYDQLESGHTWNEIYIKDYGWIPVDATSEKPFLSINSQLDLKTYSEHDPVNLGFSWTYEHNQPGYDRQYFYRVSDFDKSGMVAITMEEYQKMKDDMSANK